VRLKPRRRFRFLGFLVKSFIVIQVFDKVVFEPLYKWWDEHGEELQEERRRTQKKDDGEEEVLLFIPFPLTLERFEPQPYTGRDPEWLEFVRISKDRDMLDKIRSMSSRSEQTSRDTSLTVHRGHGKPRLQRRAKEPNP